MKEGWTPTNYSRRLEIWNLVQFHISAYIELQRHGQGGISTIQKTAPLLFLKDVFSPEILEVTATSFV